MDEVIETVVWDEAEELVARMMSELNDYPDEAVREVARVILSDRLEVTVVVD